MTDTIKVDHKSSMLCRLAGWWRSRCNPRLGAPSSVHIVDDGEAAARDAEEIQAKPRTLAGKWPAAANLLSQRFDAIDTTDADRMAAAP